MAAPGTTRIAIDRGVGIPMSDGVILRADVWRRDDEDRRPALLQRTPYDRNWPGATVHNHGLDPIQAVEAGFVVVVQDTRGRFASDGAFDPFVHEGKDGADTIAWLRTQPFCDGRVATYGGSYNGAVQLDAAAWQPPGLAAIAPMVAAPEFHDTWSYVGGALQLGFLGMWAMALAAGELARRGARGEDVAARQDELLSLLSDPWAYYERLPLDAPSVVSELIPAYAEWLAHPARDAYWRQRSTSERLHEIVVPALHIGGWWDVFLTGTLASYATLRAAGRAEQRLIVGPWAHGVLTEQVGQTYHGPAAAGAATLGAQQLAFFRAALDGELDQIAPVSLFVMGRNAWTEEDTWPPARVRVTELHLRAEQPERDGGGGGLTLAPPETGEPATAFAYDPADPVPTVGGATFMPGALVSRHSGPQDQRRLRERADVAVFTGETLVRDVELIGEVQLTLFAATDAPDTDWTAKLVVVDPNGSVLNIVDGIVRARYRQRTDRAEPIEPGAVLAYEIALGATAIRLVAGQRIELHVSSSNFPRFDRNPNHGGTIASATAGDFRVARQTIFHDAERPSRLRLPIAAGSP